MLPAYSKLAVCLALLFLLGSCSLQTYPPLVNLRVQAPAARNGRAGRGGPSFENIKCLAVAFSSPTTASQLGEGELGALSAECLGIAGIVNMGTREQVTTVGLPMAVPKGAYTVSVIGFDTTQECGSFSKAFSSLLRVYPLGSRTVDTDAETHITLTSTYDSVNATDRVAACTPATSGHRILVTRDARNGNRGGLVGADAECMVEASTLGLSGNWKAVLSSDSVSAFSRIPITGAVTNFNPGGPVIVANNSYEFWSGVHLNAVAFTGNGLISPVQVYTGTTPAGESTGQSCNNWTSSSPGFPGTIGGTNAFDSYWVQTLVGLRCDGIAPIYCISLP